MTNAERLDYLRGRVYFQGRRPVLWALAQLLKDANEAQITAVMALYTAGDIHGALSLAEQRE